MFASSGRIEIRDLRRDSLAYAAGGLEYRLTTRPWTLDQAGRMLAAAEALAEQLAPGRWPELESALWFGGRLTDLAYQRWLLQLSSGVRELLFGYMREWGSAPKDYPVRSPWFAGSDGFYYSPLLDYAEIIRTFRKAGEDA